MNTIFKTAVVACIALCAVTGARAQSAERILGTYQAIEEGKESKVEFTKLADGSYRGQIIWLKSPENPDGTPRLDEKNPDAAKRSVRADRIVIIESVKYDTEDGVWSGGRVYDPTKGKSYKVEVSFKDDNTLRVKGSLLGISRSVYWTKLK